MGGICGHAVFPGLLSLAFYGLYSIPYFAMDLLDLPFLRKYRHRGEDRPPSGSTDWLRTTSHTMYMFAMFILPGVCWQLVTRGPWLYHPIAFEKPCIMWCHGRDMFPSQAPTVIELIVQTVVCLFVFDAVYFVWHKAHHMNRQLYRHIHSVHHEYHAPFVWVTM